MKMLATVVALAIVFIPSTVGHLSYVRAEAPPKEEEDPQLPEPSLATASDTSPEPLQAPLRDVALKRVLSSCVLYVRTRMPDLPRMDTPGDLTPNASPEVGVAVLFVYNGVHHIAYLEEIQREGFWISESNFKKGKYTNRFIEWTDPHIRGFYRT